MADRLDTILQNIDRFGYSEDFGLAEQAPGSAKGLPSPTNYTVNPMIQRLTQGCSTAQLTVTVAVTGTGSGNSYNPVFLFGSDAYTNTSKGYTAVRVASPAQVTTAQFTNSKNVIRFEYATDGSNYTRYTVSQSTDGEYPFWLNQLTGDKANKVMGMQLTVSDSGHVAQLNNAVQSFALDQFGKSTSNDLTQPKDLYQQQTNGIWYTNPFDISGKKGIILNVNETNAMVLNLFMYVKPVPGCGCGGA